VVWKVQASVSGGRVDSGLAMANQYAKGGPPVRVLRHTRCQTLAYKNLDFPSNVLTPAAETNRDP
jgi:hypothetical protein